MVRSLEHNRWRAGKRMSAAALAGIAVALTGCAPLKQLVVKEPKETLIPIEKPCISKDTIPDRPIFPLDVVDLDNDKTALPNVVFAARLERKVRQQFVDGVYKILDKCSK